MCSSIFCLSRDPALERMSVNHHGRRVRDLRDQRRKIQLDRLSSSLKQVLDRPNNLASSGNEANPVAGDTSDLIAGGEPYESNNEMFLQLEKYLNIPNGSPNTSQLLTTKGDQIGFIFDNESNESTINARFPLPQEDAESPG